MLATHEETYGLGGMPTARAGAMTADRDNPFAALSNPALLPALEAPSFSFSSHYTKVSRSKLEGVLLDDPSFRTRDGARREGEYDFSDSPATLWATSFQYPFNLPTWAATRRAGIGFVASGPFGNLRSFRSGTAYDFTPLRYGTSDSQFKGTLSTGFEILPRKLSLGIGLSLFITASGDGDTTLVSSDPTARLNLDVGLNTALVAGLLYRHALPDSSHAFSLVFHQETAPKFTQSFTGTVDLGGGTASLPFTVETYGYYEPASLEVGWQGDYEEFAISLSLSAQHWKSYRPSFLAVETIDANRKSVRSITPELSLRDTFSPRVSFALPLANRQWNIGFGYQFRPSPLTETAGAVNLVDSDAHVFGAGVRWNLRPSEAFPLPLGITVSGQFHHFIPRDVKKSEARFIGAPGYRYAGNAYTFGILIGTAF